MQNIFDIWPTVADMAADLGKPYQTVAAWKQRGRIPSDHDFDIVDAAKRRGCDLTIEAIAKARVARKAEAS